MADMTTMRALTNSGMMPWADDYGIPTVHADDAGATLKIYRDGTFHVIELIVNDEIAGEWRANDMQEMMRTVKLIREVRAITADEYL